MAVARLSSDRAIDTEGEGVGRVVVLPFLFHLTPFQAP
jgi:hypothetical protein